MDAQVGNFSMRSRLSLRICAALALAGMLAAGCVSSGPAPATIDAAAAAKIAPVLQAAARQLQNGTALPAHGPVRSDAQGRIQIYIYVSNTSSDTVTALVSNGLQETLVSPELKVVQGWAKPQDLTRLAELPVVVRIAPPQYARPR